MPALWPYLRKHRWQRRLLTASLALALGGVAAILALPYVRSYLLLADLASKSYAVRVAAIDRGARLALQSPTVLRQLEAALDSDDDRQFSAIVAVLKRLGRFTTAGRAGPHVDRMWALELETNPSGETRELFLTEMALAGRDSAFVRRALRAAGKDEAPAVRARSAVLAARLGDDKLLATLLGDADPNVAAAAAIDAGIARRSALATDVARLLADGADPNVSAAAAYALARTDPSAAATRLAPLLVRAEERGEQALRDRLLYAIAELPPAVAGPAPLGVIERARKAGRHPSAYALLLAGRLRLNDAAGDVRNVLAAAVRSDGGVLIGQVHAAVEAAGALDLPVRAELIRLIDRLWRHDPAYRLMLTAGVRALARQASVVQRDPNAPTADDCVRMLRKAAVYPTDWPPGTDPEDVQTPLPSAAAAVALWQLDAPLAEEFVTLWAGSDLTLPGDYVSWHLGLAGGPGAFELGLRFVPPLDAPRSQREYNDDRRGTGAMLLAVAARTEEQKGAARRRVRSRLEGGDLGGEDNFYVRGAYRCALAVLGDADSLRHVAGLLETGQFSQRRAITALTLAGSLDGLDWLLWNPQVDEEDMLLLLVDEQVAGVLSACLPSLPALDAAAGTALQSFQLRILRDAYLLRRPTLRPAWPPPRASSAAGRPATMPAR